MNKKIIVEHNIIFFYCREFDDSVQSLIKLKRCADIDLKEEVKRNWEEIKTFEYCFDRLEKEVYHLSSGISRKDLLKFLMNMVKKSRKLLTLHVIGQTEETPSPSDGTNSLTPDSLQFSFDSTQQSTPKLTIVTDLNSFKQTLELYPPHKLT